MSGFHPPFNLTSYYYNIERENDRLTLRIKSNDLDFPYIINFDATGDEAVVCLHGWVSGWVQ